VPAAQAATIEVHPGTDVFGPAAEGLVAGDILIVHQGTYVETKRMSIQVRGTASAPIVITGANGEKRPLVTRDPAAEAQNTINIEGSASYLTLRGLEITGVPGGDGVSINGDLSYITLEDLVIHDIDVGIGAHTSMHHITIRRNHIYNTGMDSGTGEGMYVGCNWASCAVSNSLVEGNWIHDGLPGITQGDGIEIKVGSHSNIVRDNVIYNRPYPGILVYGTATNPPNIVEGNVIWACAEGIVAIADAVVRNNIVFQSGSGLSLYGHEQVAEIRNVTAVNNTLFDNDDGIYVRWGGTNMILANNAVYSPGKNAVNSGSGVNPTSGTVAANYVEGNMTGDALDGARFVAGGAAAAALANPGGRDFWPAAGSPLIGAAAAAQAPAVDFNGTARTSPMDVGAYETNGVAGNPGWAIAQGFKGGATPCPTCQPDARVAPRDAAGGGDRGWAREPGGLGDRPASADAGSPDARAGSSAPSSCGCQASTGGDAVVGLAVLLTVVFLRRRP
jgi:MYXO-CTERM domain-containing protein